MSDMKLISSILNSKVTSKIIKLLMKKEMYNEEITNKLNRKAPQTHYQIQKLLKLKLLTVRPGYILSRPVIFYKMKPDFVEIITSKIAKEFK